MRSESRRNRAPTPALAYAAIRSCVEELSRTTRGVFCFMEHISRYLVVIIYRYLYMCQCIRPRIVTPGFGVEKIRAPAWRAAIITRPPYDKGRGEVGDGIFRCTRLHVGRAPEVRSCLHRYLRHGVWKGISTTLSAPRQQLSIGTEFRRRGKHHPQVFRMRDEKTHQRSSPIGAART